VQTDIFPLRKTYSCIQHVQTDLDSRRH